MRQNFAQILKDAKIDIKVEYQKLYGMLYDRSIPVSNTNRISVYDELSTYFIAFCFRGTCLSLDEFNDLHGFHFEKDPTNFNIDHLISLCEYIENLLIAYQCVPLSYPYGYGNMPTKLIDVQFYLQQISQVIEKIGYMQAKQNDLTIFVEKDPVAIAIALQRLCNAVSGLVPEPEKGSRTVKEVDLLSFLVSRIARSTRVKLKPSLNSYQRCLGCSILAEKFGIQSSPYECSQTAFIVSMTFTLYQ